MICADAEEPGKSTCFGDSGGPLAVKGEDGKYSLIGIVSFGDVDEEGTCSTVGWPNVFTRVTAFIQWIENNKKQ